MAIQTGDPGATIGNQAPYGGGAAGEVNTAINYGTEGVGLYDSKAAEVLRFRNLVSPLGSVGIVYNATTHCLELEATAPAPTPVTFDNEFHVAKNGNDGDAGNLSAPFLTVNAAFAAVAAAPGAYNRVVIHPGVYTETFALTCDTYTLVELQGANLVGNFTWTNTVAAVTFGPKLILQGHDLRDFYPNAGYKNTCLQGNLTVVQDTTLSRYAAVHLMNSGVWGNIDYQNNGASSAILSHLYVWGGGWTGNVTTTGDKCTVYVYAYSSGSSSSASLGGCNGQVIPNVLHSVRLEDPWIIAGASIAGGGGGQWYNVRFDAGSDFGGMKGSVRADANSFASYDAIANKGTETFTLIDKASGVGNDSGVDGATVKEALDALLAASPPDAGAIFKVADYANDIAATIAAAAPGDTVLLNPGLTDLGAGQIVVDKRIRLLGYGADEGADGTQIRSTHGGAAIQITTAASGIGPTRRLVFEGFILEGSSSGVNGFKASAATVSYISLYDVRVRDFTSYAFFNDVSAIKDMQAYGCIFTDNGAAHIKAGGTYRGLSFGQCEFLNAGAGINSKGTGLYFSSGDVEDLLMVDCLVRDSALLGMYVADNCKNIIIENSQFIRNGWDPTLAAESSGIKFSIHAADVCENVRITGCLFERNGEGATTGVGSDVGLGIIAKASGVGAIFRNVLIEDTRFVNNKHTGLLVFGKSSGVADVNIVTRNCEYVGHPAYGLSTIDYGSALPAGTVDATGCYWGANDGPSGDGPGNGDAVSLQVTFAGFLTGNQIASRVENDSTVSGATVADALDALEAAAPNTHAASHNIGGGDAVTSMRTGTAAAGISYSGNSAIADGTDSHIDINFRPKGSGRVVVTSLHVNSETVSGTVTSNTIKAWGGNFLLSRSDTNDPSRFITRHGPTGAFTAYGVTEPAAAPTAVGDVAQVTSLTGGLGGEPQLGYAPPIVSAHAATHRAGGADALSTVRPGALATEVAGGAEILTYTSTVTSQIDLNASPSLGERARVKRLDAGTGNVLINGGTNSVQSDAGTSATNINISVAYAMHSWFFDGSSWLQE